MKKNTILIITIIFLIGLNLLLLVKMYNNNQQPEVTKPTNYSSQTSISDSTLTMIKHLSAESDGKVLNGDIILVTSDGEEMTLRQLVSNVPVLVFNYTKYSCKVCIEDELQRLSSFSAKIGSENIIIIGQFETAREQYVMENTYGLKFYHFNESTFDLPVDSLDLAYMFVLNDQLQTNGVYLPIKEFSAMTDVYLSLVLSKFY